jgi:hypothetical protein
MVDEHHGKGGTYTVNPKSGKRELVEGSRTEPAPAQAVLEEEAAPAAAPKAAQPKAPEPAPNTSTES